MKDYSWNYRHMNLVIGVCFFCVGFFFLGMFIWLMAIEIIEGLPSAFQFKNPGAVAFYCALLVSSLIFFILGSGELKPIIFSKKEDNKIEEWPISKIIFLSTSKCRFELNKNNTKIYVDSYIPKDSRRDLLVQKGFVGNIAGVKRIRGEYFLEYIIK